MPGRIDQPMVVDINFEYPDDEKIWGTDVSFWQDVDETARGIDYNKMKGEGADFVFIRAGQGQWPDTDFKVNWAAAKEAGLLRGAYWFLDCRYSANSQALLFKSLLGSDPGELRPVVDYEHTAYVSEKDRRGKTRTVPKYLSVTQLDGFITTLNWPVEPMIYTGYYYWRDHGSTDVRFARNPLWIAAYKTAKPSIPAPWKDYLFWQFSETGNGKVLGAESNAIDLDYFNGTKEQLLKYAGKPVEIPETPEPDVPFDVKLSGKLIQQAMWTDESGTPHQITKEFDF